MFNAWNIGLPGSLATNPASPVEVSADRQSPWTHRLKRIINESWECPENRRDNAQFNSDSDQKGFCVERDDFEKILELPRPFQNVTISKIFWNFHVLFRTSTNF